MPEEFRNKRRNADITILASRRRHDMTTERNLRHVKLLKLEISVKGLLRLNRSCDGFTAFDRCPAVEYCFSAIIIAASQAYFQFSHELLQLRSYDYQLLAQYDMVARSDRSQQ